MRRVFPACTMAILSLCGWTFAGAFDRSAYVAGSQWNAYNGSSSNSHFSSLNQINRANVSSLTQAWEYHSGDGPAPGWYEFNPLIVEGVMYVVTAGGALAALDPASGKELWRFKPTGPIYNSRGASFWRDPNPPHDVRVLFLSGATAHDGNADLHAIDARTGQPIKSFGDDGLIPLGVPVNSPGVIYQNLIILGSAQGKRGAGQVRAYDVRTGKMQWAFQTIPKRGDPGAETWGEQGPEKASGANCWGGMAIDVKRGVVYLATAQPKTEPKGLSFFGGDFQGRNRFSSSVIALNAKTGKLVWDFQETRHDIWDFDIPAPPNLVRLKFKGREIDAVAQVTKRGNTLLLDRDTGALLYPAKERAAPPSTVPTEKASPTQLEFITPEPFAKTTFTEDDVTDLNPQAHEAVLARFKAARTGWFEPPSTQGTIFFGPQGGAEWGGAAYDVSSHRLYVNSNHVPWFIKMRETPRVPANQAAFDRNPENVARRAEQEKHGAEYYQQYCSGCHGATRKGEGGAPSLRAVGAYYLQSDVVEIATQGRGHMPPVAAALPAEIPEAIAAYLCNVDRDLILSQSNSETGYVPPYTTTPTGIVSLDDPEGFPASKPPWGTLNAINLDTGKIEWRVPLGEYPKLRERGVPPTGTLNAGGSVVTAGGLLFISATEDAKMRAFDTDTGKVLWEAQLPFFGRATPATYLSNGRQYVVIASGGEGTGDAYIAFALEPGPHP